MQEFYYTLDKNNNIEKRKFLKLETINSKTVIYLSRINDETFDKFYSYPGTLNKYYFLSVEDANNYVLKNNSFISAYSNSRDVSMDSIIDMFNCFPQSLREKDETEELEHERKYKDLVVSSLKEKEEELKNKKDILDDKYKEAWEVEREAYEIRREEIKESNETNMYSDAFLTNILIASAIREEARPEKKDYDFRMKTLNQQKKIPFIARVDYGKSESELHSIYIGTTSIKGYVEDWRNRLISEVYNYSDYYSTREGYLYGLKRVYIYDGENIKTYNDVIDYMKGENNSRNLDKNTDPFFEKILTDRRNSNSSLDIVATMRQNQYSIISSAFNQNVIVDGVAGSGKTMVLYHRLSYIAYNDFDFVHENSFVVGPTKVFSKELDPLASELELHKTVNLSYDDLILELLKRYYKNYVNYRGLLYSGQQSLNHEADFLLNDKLYNEFKSYLEFSDSFLKYVNKFINSIMNKYGIIPYDYFTDMKSSFENVRYKRLPFTHENPIFKEYLKYKKDLEYISEENVTALLSEISDSSISSTYYDNKEFFNFLMGDRTLFNENGSVNIKEAKDILAHFSNKNNLKRFKDMGLAYSIFDSVNTYFKENELISCAYDLLIDFALSKYKKDNGLKENYYFENIFKLRAFEDYFGKINRDKCYLFIDEYQNYSLLEIDALINAFDDPIMNLFGDINQRIKDTGIKNINEIINNYHTHLYTLNFNYRNAIDITKYINESLDIDMKGIGIRGEAKEIKDLPNNIIIINKTAILSKDISKYRNDIYNIVDDTNAIEKNKVNVLSLGLSKGLEFDTLYVDTKDMNKNEKYVAFTRALNNLYILKGEDN